MYSGFYDVSSGKSWSSCQNALRHQQFHHVTYHVSVPGEPPAYLYSSTNTLLRCAHTDGDFLPGQPFTASGNQVYPLVRIGLHGSAQ